ncbi:GPI inositol deacylase [Entophlyctis sp. JEL0112]|nr:GPI inositol deacylase [Entophlyctis sp. JEL0112]
MFRALAAFVAVVALPLAAIFKGVYNDVQGVSLHSGCRMTWMYPTYSRVPLPTTLENSKYSLFVYREGHDYRSAEIEIPVLFIPGNAGSYKQARSIASVANVFANADRALRVFTVDTVNELAALDSALIFDQANFVNHAIAAILDSYSSSQSAYRPTSVLIVAHSMGGKVAQAALTLRNYIGGSVHSIITLATPHRRPPIAIQKDMVMLYENLDEYWADHLYRNDSDAARLSFGQLLAVSVAGGERDSMVDSGDCELGHLISAAHGFTAYSTGVPDVWVSADHRCILWCNQLVKVIVAGLYGSFDARGNPTRLENRLSTWKALLTASFDPAAPPAAAARIENTGRPTVFAHSNKKTVFVDTASALWDPAQFHVLSAANAKQLKGYSQNLAFELFACTGSSFEAAADVLDQRSGCVNLRNSFAKVPKEAPSNVDGSVDEFVEVLNLSLEKKFATILLRVVAAVGGSHGHLSLAIHDELDSDLVVFQNYGLAELLKSTTVTVPVKSTSVKLVFPGISESIIVYEMNISPHGQCESSTSPLVYLNVTGTSETKFLYRWKDSSFPLRFHNDAKTGLSFWVFTDSATVESCKGYSYDVKLEINWFGTLVNVLRRNIGLFIVLVSAFCSLTFVGAVFGNGAAQPSKYLANSFWYGIVGIGIRFAMARTEVFPFPDQKSAVAAALSYSVMYPLAFWIACCAFFGVTAAVVFGSRVFKFLPARVQQVLQKTSTVKQILVALIFVLACFSSSATLSTAVLSVTAWVASAHRGLSPAAPRSQAFSSILRGALLFQCVALVLTLPRVVVYGMNLSIGWTKISMSGQEKVLDYAIALAPAGWLYSQMESPLVSELETDAGEPPKRALQIFLNVASSLGLLSLFVGILAMCESSTETHSLGFFVFCIFGVVLLWKLMGGLAEEEDDQPPPKKKQE